VSRWKDWWRNICVPGSRIAAISTSWRVEVDFVVYGTTGLWAIEVKNSARVRPEDLLGLTAFREDYPQSRCVLLYRGREHLRINHIDCQPVSQFLLQLHPDTPLFGRKK
jgi:hypothetical protein